MRLPVHPEHKTCVACGPDNKYGLHLAFAPAGPGAVQGAIFCRKELTGYDGLLQGGVAALMLDSAMANCLFSSSVTAFTAEMSLKYHAPVLIGRAAVLKAWIEKDYSPLYLMRSQLLQDGILKVEAGAKFMRKPL